MGICIRLSVSSAACCLAEPLVLDRVQEVTHACYIYGVEDSTLPCHIQPENRRQHAIRLRDSMPIPRGSSCPTLLYMLAPLA